MYRVLRHRPRRTASLGLALGLAVAGATFFWPVVPACAEAVAPVGDANDLAPVTAAIGYTLPAGWSVTDQGADYLYFGVVLPDRTSSTGSPYQPGKSWVDIVVKMDGFGAITSRQELETQVGTSGGSPVTSGDATIDGRQAWTAESESDASGDETSSTRRRAYWVPVEGGGYLVTTGVTASSPYWGDPSQVPADLEVQSRQIDGLIGSLQLPGSLNAASPSAGPPKPSRSGGGTPWRTIGAGALALAAAAAALAGAFSSTPQGRARAKRDPNAVVGYILQLSVRSLSPRSDVSVPLAATAWRVRASGTYDPADDVAVLLLPLSITFLR